MSNVEALRRSGELLLRLCLIARRKKHNPQSSRRNDFSGAQISRLFLLLTEDLSASNYSGTAKSTMAGMERQPRSRDRRRSLGENGESPRYVNFLLCSAEPHGNVKQLFYHPW